MQIEFKFIGDLACNLRDRAEPTELNRLRDFCQAYAMGVDSMLDFDKRPEIKANILHRKLNEALPFFVHGRLGVASWMVYSFIKAEYLGNKLKLELEIAERHGSE